MDVTTLTQSEKLLDLSPPRQSFRADVKEGLQKSPPEVPCKYLYDRRGSTLFDRICELEEYYPTRTEMQIMRDHCLEIATEMGEDVLLIEYGSGSSLKTRILLDCLEGIAGYVPIDISKEHLREAASELSEEYCGLRVRPISADYTQKIALPDDLDGRRVIYFPGSTIGNFTRDESVQMLKRFAATVGEGGHVLIGVDLKKDTSVLHRAYNDDQGITAMFNKNMLHRMKRELGVEVDPEAFAHRAIYHAEPGCVEMRLVCRRPQSFQMDGITFSFEPGDYIRTERSHKYTIDEFAELASEAGLSLQKAWTDDQDFFSVQYYKVE